jgi:hypothetical protein
MRALLQPQMVVVLFVLVRAGDLCFCAAITHQTVRAVVYGLVALLALIVLVFALLGQGG